MKLLNKFRQKEDLHSVSTAEFWYFDEAIHIKVWERSLRNYQKAIYIPHKV